MGVEDECNVPVLKDLQLLQGPESTDRYLWDWRADKTDKGQRVKQNEKKAKTEMPLFRRCPAFWPHCSSYKWWVLDQHWEYLVIFKIWLCHCYSSVGQEGARVHRGVKTDSRMEAALGPGHGEWGSNGRGKGRSNIALWEFLLQGPRNQSEDIPHPQGRREIY